MAQQLYNKTILFTGGGSAGHVVPHWPLIKKFQQAGWQPVYIGTAKGIERQIIAPLQIPYYVIASGKLRRYLSWKNLLTPFQVLFAIVQAWYLCWKIKPAVVFSKGGFVAFPVVVAAWAWRIPIVAHESDLTPGLANRLAFPLVKKICLTFAEGARFFSKQDKIVVTGTPIRAEFFTADPAQGLAWCGFVPTKKVLLIYGGGLGSAVINQTVRSVLPELLSQFQIVHICGQGKMQPELACPGYKQFEYLHDELFAVMKMADIVLSRAGANSIYELLALGKPHILVPLSQRASRGDQIANAAYFAQQNYSVVCAEENFNGQHLLTMLDYIATHTVAIKQKLSTFAQRDSTEEIYQLLIAIAGQQDETKGNGP